MSRCNDSRALVRSRSGSRWQRSLRLGGLAVLAVLGLARMPHVHAAESASATSIRNMVAADPAAAKSRDAAVVSALPKPGRGRQTLRCWQEGKLVFESASVAPGVPSAVAIELRSTTRAELAVQVFDLKQGLCVIEYGSEP